MRRYDKIRKSIYRKQLNEKNDCAVVALAVVCRTSYKSAHELLQIMGRKTGQGTRTYLTLRSIVSAGFKLEGVKKLKQKNGSKFTPKTIGDKLKRGYYLCSCNGHVFAVVNGEVEDWTNNRQHHITDAYKVTRLRA